MAQRWWKYNILRPQMMDCWEKLEDWYGTSQKIAMWAQGMAQRREGLLVISSNSLGWEFLILKGSCKK